MFQLIIFYSEQTIQSLTDKIPERRVTCFSGIFYHNYSLLCVWFFAKLLSDLYPIIIKSRAAAMISNSTVNSYIN